MILHTTRQLVLFYNIKEVLPKFFVILFVVITHHPINRTYLFYHPIYLFVHSGIDFLIKNYKTVLNCLMRKQTGFQQSSEYSASGNVFRSISYRTGFYYTVVYI